MNNRISFLKGQRGVKKEEGFSVTRTKRGTDVTSNSSINRLSRAIIFTDGSYKNNLMGSSYVLCQRKTSNYRDYGMDDVIKYGYVTEKGGGSLEAELIALTEALKQLPKKIKKVSIYTDSIVIADRMNEGMLDAWGDSNFTSLRNTFNELREHWEYVYRIGKKVDIDLIWVKGHENTKLNIFADRIANVGSDK